MAKRITSRYAKKQKQKLTKQTIMLFGLTILIGAVFIFVVLPNAVQLFFNILDKNTDITNTQVIPPQPPIVSFPPEYTNQARITLNGYALANEKIEITLNQKEEITADVDENGEFEVELGLNDGENVLTLVTVEGDDNESSAKTLTIFRDDQPPEINITQPDNNTEFRLKQDQVITIKGETEPKSQVYLDKQLTYANNEGNFSFRHQLNNGENKLKIRVVDRAGNESEKELTVYYLY